MAGTDKPEFENALDRLDTMLARLEAAVAQPDGAAAELRSLRAAHESMRTKVGEALADLDGLLAEIGAHE